MAESLSFMNPNCVFCDVLPGHKGPHLQYGDVLPNDDGIRKCPVCRWEKFTVQSAFEVKCSSCGKRLPMQ